MHDEARSEETLPTGRALVTRLYEQGLAYPGCEKIPSSPEDWYYLGDTVWHPWRRIDHCWYLVEQFKLSVLYQPVWERGRLRPNWWVGEQGSLGVSVATFAELPTAICQASIKIYAWRTSNG